VLKPAEGCDHFVPIKRLNQPVQQALTVVWPRFEIFLKDALVGANGLKHRLLVGHNAVSGTIGKMPLTYVFGGLKSFN
jgi:hypothetical protein